MESIVFIIRTRFSLFLPNSNGWNISRNLSLDEITEYKNNLFEEKRLNFRIRFLTKITLPLLEQASKDYELLHIIEYSDCLPARYISNLKDLEEKYSFLKLSLYDHTGKPQKKNNQIAIEYFNLKERNKDFWIGRLTLDDDDCVSLNYFSMMNKYLIAQFEDFYISLGLGVAGVYDENNKLTDCVEIYKPKVNIGFMLVGRYCCRNERIYFTPKTAPHMTMDKAVQVVLDSREISFYWSRHASQDTRLNKTQHQINNLIMSIKNLPEFSKERLDKSFGINFYEKINSFDSDEDMNLSI